MTGHEKKLDLINWSKDELFFEDLPYKITTTKKEKKSCNINVTGLRQIFKIQFCLRISRFN
jgi:hypothetical protein